MRQADEQNNIETKFFKIKDIKVIQAPLAGVSDIVFRKLIRKYSPDCLLTTEMIASEALCCAFRHPDKAIKSKILQFEKAEYPLCFQLVGHKPEMMGRAAEILNEFASSIDINFGCPVSKIVKNQEGSAMMKTPDLARKIVAVIKEKISVPLSAKFRLGWDFNDENFIEFAKMLENEGINFVTLHARTRSQLYSGASDWGKIGKLKKEVKIPVFANGDIKTLEDAVNCLNLTKADGASIARGLMGDFTLPDRIEHFLKTGEKLSTPPLNERFKMLKEHIEGEIELMGEINGLKFMRKFYPFYIQGIKNASKYRQRLVLTLDKKEITDTLDEILCLHTSNC